MVLTDSHSYMGGMSCTMKACMSQKHDLICHAVNVGQHGKYMINLGLTSLTANAKVVSQLSSMQPQQNADCHLFSGALQLPKWLIAMGHAVICMLPA